MTTTLLAKAADNKPPPRAANRIETEVARIKVWVEDRVEAAKKEPLVEVVTLTPVLARALLARNEHNRSLSPVAMDRFKRDIVEGRWEFNGEPIIVSRDGHLNDGQHRCTAVAETGRSVRCTIVFGVSRESRMTLDQGVTRTVGHYLGMKGFTDANKVAAVAGMIWQHCEYQMIGKHPDRRPTKSQVLLVAESYKGIPESVRFCSRQGAGALTSMSLLAFVHFSIAHVAGNHAADDFLDKLIKGNDLASGDPILVARNRLISMRRDTGWSMTERAELLFKAWNHHRSGDSIDRIMIGGKKLPKLEA